MSDYAFDDWLTRTQQNWYEDDALLQQLLTRYAGPRRQEELARWGEAVSTRLRVWADASGRPENRPQLRHFDAHNRRVDEVVLPGSTLASLAEVEGRQRLGAVRDNPFEYYAQIYLAAQNGEAGVACSVACTDGMVRLLEALGDRPVHRTAVERIRGSTPERVWHAAQFVTEIQGGSDVPANSVVARPDGAERYRLFGQKWFCSNIQADYFVVTARPEGAPAGAKGIALFLVPARLDERDLLRNGYRIERLKDKLGTCELPTAEVTFEGAVAHPVGPLDRGLANLLAYVLVTSRFGCIVFAAGALRQAERIAGAYADFRSAFGHRLSDYALVRDALDQLGQARAVALGSTFELLRLWEAARQGRAEEAADFRILLSLAKPVLTRLATTQVHEAMMLLAGNGIEERFSALPRLYRDAAIMETWEGPHNVLFQQAFRDLARFEVDPDRFVARVAGEPRPALAEELRRLLRGEPQATSAFARWAEQLVMAFGARAAG
jgi:alkylation response protein AidB-like acyl-CoA dehydrogenase